MTQPNILYFDIETSHLLVYIYSLGNQYVGQHQIKKERKILAISYVWNNDKKAQSLILNLDKHDLQAYDDDADYEMLKKFVDVYKKADLAVAFNGRKFDVARLRARLVKYNLPDMHPVLFDDTYRMTKDIDFTSHKLDYLGRYLGLGRKIPTNADLWIRVMEGNKQALKEMSDYCDQDVLLLRKAHKRLKRYGKSQLNLSIFHENPGLCPKCGGKLVKDGTVQRGLAKKQSYECSICKSKTVDGNNLIKHVGSYPR